MSKIAVFVALLFIAVAVAGFYGALHDQISYTVSPEYFTKFKFRQFGLLDLAWPDRARAAWVGFLVSWWMGIPIGWLVGAVAFIHRDARQMFRVGLASYGVAVATTLLVGLCGLAWGFWTTRNGINRANYAGWFMPDDVVNLRRFLCAGWMHNSSYLGGLLAIGAAWLYQLVVRFRR